MLLGDRASYSYSSELLNTWQATVIKGNAGELAALANSSEVRYQSSQMTLHLVIDLSNKVKARGVDSVGAGFADPAQFVKDLARAERASAHTPHC